MTDSVDQSEMEELSPEEKVAARIKELEGGIPKASEAGDWPTADLFYTELRCHNAQPAEVIAEHAKAVFNAGDAARAATMTRRALRLSDGDAEIKRQLADIYYHQDRSEESEALYREVIDADPKDADAKRRLSQILQKRDHGSAEAEEILKQVIEEYPEDVKALMLLGAIYANDRSRYHEAEPVFERVLELDPKAPSALHNYGLLKRFQGDLDKAEEYLKKACEVYPDDTDFVFSLGTCYMFMHRIEEALECFERAIELKPDNNAAQVYKAYALFHLGRMLEGWEQYEKRLNLDILQQAKVERPLWNGEEMDGKTLLLTPEQGMGDNIQFVRYATIAAERGAKVIIATHQPLIRLFQSIPNMAAVASEIPAPWHFNRYSPLLSMPHALKTEADSIPGDVPYLSAPEDVRQAWEEKLSQYKGCRVGLNWRGNPRHVNDAFRSTSLEDISQLMDIDGATFFSLLKDRPEDEQDLPDGLVDIGTEFDDFADTAGAIEALDLVITVDTSVAHVAGAVGRPVWTMIARGPDFRWGLEGDKTPWYPTMTLYRQDSLGDWSSVYERLKSDLATFVAAKD